MRLRIPFNRRILLLTPVKNVIVMACELSSAKHHALSFIVSH
jgi:hypothetical protein